MQSLVLLRVVTNIKIHVVVKTDKVSKPKFCIFNHRLEHYQLRIITFTYIIWYITSLQKIQAKPLYTSMSQNSSLQCTQKY
jgi:hypothetical protein